MPFIHHIQSEMHLLCQESVSLIELHQASICCDETIIGVGGN